MAETATQTAKAVVAAPMLVSLAEYYLFAGISAPSNATQIEQAIKDATSALAQTTGRFFSVGRYTQAVEEFRGDGGLRYFPRQAPVVSVDAVEYWDGSDWESVDSNYTPYTDGNYIAFREGLRFSRSKINLWRVTYTFGYARLPEDLKRALCLLAKFNSSAPAQQQLASQSDGEQSFSYFKGSSEPPKEVDDVFARYGRFYTYG